jgi:large subunit ribosomal protein L31
MKSEIHPKYFNQAKVSCACGREFMIGSTKPELKVEICSNCHPFYTGKEKLIDAMGKVDKFKARKAKAETKPARTKTTKLAAKKEAKVAKKNKEEK